MTYAEQLKHPQWQRRRLEILERAEFKCEWCRDSEKTLHVHHKIYFKGRKAWEYNDNCLVALCEDCHAEWHELNEYIESCVSCLSKQGMLDLLEVAEMLVDGKKLEITVR